MRLRAALLIAIGLGILSLGVGPFRMPCSDYEQAMRDKLDSYEKCLKNIESKKLTHPESEVIALCKAQNDALLESQVKFHQCKNGTLPQTKE